MQRRNFIKDTGRFVFGIGIAGSIRWNAGGYVGDTATTTDILGPFYRPGAPLRKTLNPTDFKGEALHLSGTVFKEDGKTPQPACLLEIWQCNADGVYDTISDEFTYRASQKTAADGRYHFITTQPIAYPVEEGSTIYRPAHIHLRTSAQGSQDLITQIYFSGDPYLDGDPSTKSPLASKRILSLHKIRDNESEIRFDVVLKKEYLPEDAVFHQVAGVYKMSNNTVMEFYRNGDLLFYKTNSQIWGALSYAGNNTFIGGVNDTEAKFETLPSGATTVRFQFIRRRKTELVGTKAFAYD